MDHEKIYMTKERLLKGAELIEEVEIDLRGETVVFRIRPLVDGERARAEALAMKGIKAQATGGTSSMDKMDMDMDMDSVISNRWESKFFILACGLSVEKEKFSTSDVKKFALSKEVIETLVSRIRDISGMGKGVEDDLRSFRGDDKGGE